MRALAVVLVGAALLAGAARGADPSPRALVLGPSDVPRGFVLDRERSGLRTNTAEAKRVPRLGPVFRKWGRVSGYEVEYDRGEATIGSRVDLMRTRAGARGLLAWYDLEVRKAGVRGLRRSSARVGDQAWMYGAPKPLALTILFWRQDRAFAAIIGDGITRARTLELAAAQERRIAEELR